MKRGVQVAFPVVIAVLLLLGSFFGEDHHFPFGPLRMYSTKQELDARIRVLELWGSRGEDGWVRLNALEFGMRRADLEGQLGKLAQEPSAVLARLATSYERVNGSPLPYDALQFRNKIYQLEDGEPHSESSQVIDTWHRDPSSDLET